MGALHRAALADWATAAGLAVVSLITLVCWVVAWRRRLRADGILARTSRRQARREREGEAAASAPDPAQVLSELRTLLVPLLAEPANGQAGNGQAANGQAANGQAGNGQAANGQADGYEPRPAGPGTPAGPGMPVVPAARSGGLAAMGAMLAGAELLMVGGGEEEAW